MSLKTLWAPGVIDPKDKYPGVNPYTGPTKSEPVYDCDITKALHQEGGWYLMSKQHCYQYHHLKNLDSIVFHVCSKSWLTKSNPNERGVERITVTDYTSHRYRADEMDVECGYCSERPPESVVALWTLHNWDYLCLNDHTA